MYARRNSCFASLNSYSCSSVLSSRARSSLSFLSSACYVFWISSDSSSSSDSVTIAPGAAGCSPLLLASSLALYFLSKYFLYRSFQTRFLSTFVESLMIFWSIMSYGTITSSACVECFAMKAFVSPPQMHQLNFSSFLKSMSRKWIHI